MSIIYRILMLAIFLIMIGCDWRGDTHELSHAGFNTDFSFEGYVADNGDRWVYFLTGEAGKYEISEDSPLMESGNLFACPGYMHVEVQDGKLEYSLSDGAEGLYSRDESEKCVTYYTEIFNSHVNQRLKNAETY